MPALLRDPGFRFRPRLRPHDEEGHEGLSRRSLLQSAGALAFGTACQGGRQQETGRASARFEPFPIDHLSSLVTPKGDFFVRDHFGVPGRAESDPQGWSVSIEGDVARPMAHALGALVARRRQELLVTLECAGNAGRNGLGWPGGARAWGGASTGLFSGISLAELLAEARPAPTATEVVLEGMDEGQEPGMAAPEPFARSVPLSVARSQEPLLALEMNGARLPALHGGPVRAILPGRYATDSVKWLRRVRVVSKPFEGFFQAQRYRRASSAEPRGSALGTLRIQSEISHPRPGDRLPRGMRVDVVGVAWGGQGGASLIEVSVDGGQSFAPATFLDQGRPYCWRRWRWTWEPRSAGPRLILARATDHAGTAQPLASDEELGLGYSLSGPDRIQYANNQAPIIPVTVV